MSVVRPGWNLKRLRGLMDDAVARCQGGNVAAPSRDVPAHPLQQQQGRAVSVRLVEEPDAVGSVDEGHALEPTPAPAKR